MVTGTDGNLLFRYESYLRDRRQKVVINGHISEWGDPAGLPQGAELGPVPGTIDCQRE